MSKNERGVPIRREIMTMKSFFDVELWPEIHFRCRDVNDCKYKNYTVHGCQRSSVNS